MDRVAESAGTLEMHSYYLSEVNSLYSQCRRQKKIAFFIPFVLPKKMVYFPIRLSLFCGVYNMGKSQNVSETLVNVQKKYFEKTTFGNVALYIILFTISGRRKTSCMIILLYYLPQ